MIFSQTVDLPEAVPPATPIRNGADRIFAAFWLVVISAAILPSQMDHLK
jgi:hypothetical protein